MTTPLRHSSGQIEPDPPPAPEGFIYEAVPKSAKEAISARAEARVRMTVKSALQRYLADYLDAAGPKRHQIDSAIPYAIQFVTDITGAADPDDPTIIQVQLARIWTSLREKLPAVIIVDTNYQYKRAGAGGLERGRRIPNPDGSKRDKDTIIVQKMMATIGIQLMLGAISESEASDLGDAVSTILGPLTDFNRGHVITPGKPTDRWEVRLPWRFESAGLERRNIGDDQRDSMWSTSINLEVEFEGEIQQIIHHPADPDVMPISGATPAFDPSCKTPEQRAFPLLVTAPSKISLHDHPLVMVDNYPAWSVLVSNDTSVAVVDEAGVIHPRRFGTFKLLLLYDPPGATTPQTLFSQEITVSPY